MCIAKKNTIIRLVFASCIIVTLAGCVTTNPPSSASTSSIASTSASALVLSDSMLKKNKGNVEGLYESWITPFKTKDKGFIQHANENQLYASEDAVKDGFSRFCSISGGIIKNKQQKFGDTYKCETTKGVFIGRFTTRRITGHFLRVRHVTPKQVAKHKLKKKALDERKAQNGPTGWITTTQGKFKFLRIGNLKSRDVLSVQLVVKSKEIVPFEIVPIEDVARVDFHTKCCNADVKLKDGRTKTVNSGHFFYRHSLNVTSTYGIGSSGMPFVIVEPASGQPYTQRYDTRNIKSIVFDKKSKWANKSGGLIDTKFDIRSKSRFKRYIKKMGIKANKLYREATNNGSIKLLPDGKLTPELTKYLRYELVRITRSSACSDNVVDGITSIDATLRCRAAAREFLLVVGSQYSLVTEVTPLSAIIVLEKLKRDIR